MDEFSHTQRIADVVPARPVIVAEPLIETVPDRARALMHESLRPWKVIVYDDDVNTMDFVVAVFQQLFGFALEEATRKMLEVHLGGRSIVMVGPLEECEYYVERLGACGLTTGLERD